MAAHTTTLNNLQTLPRAPQSDTNAVSDQTGSAKAKSYAKGRGTTHEEQIDSKGKSGILGCLCCGGSQPAGMLHLDGVACRAVTAQTVHCITSAA